MSALNDGERSVAVAALYAYRAETTHYLRGYDQPDAGHDDCCTVARARADRRRQERNSLNERLSHIDGALLALNPDAFR